MIDVNCLQPIFLGNQGENLARTLEFDVSSWLGQYPGAGIVMLVQRPEEDTPYIAVTQVENGVLRWTPTNADTAIAGTGKIMLRLILGEKVRKSAICTAFVAKSLDEPGDAPDPAQAWVDQVIDAANKAEEGAMAALEELEPRVPPADGTPGNVLTKTEDGSEWQQIGGTLPVRDGESGMDFLARVDVYDLLTDGEGNLLVDNEGEPLYGAVNADSGEAEAGLEAALEAANAAQETADSAQTIAAQVGRIAVNAMNTATNAQNVADAAASKTNPVFTGSFSQNRKSNTTVGGNSHAEGYECTASAYNSHAEGSASEATEFASHAEGRSTASGEYSHAEGRSTASGENSHAEGNMTTASGTNSHAEGQMTKASGICAHAEGQGSKASGRCSHVEGLICEAASDNQHVSGKYNIVDNNGKYAEIVGNGNGSATKSNARTLDWSGNAWYAGTVEGKALIVKSATDGSSKRYQISIGDDGKPVVTDLSDSSEVWKPDDAGVPAVTVSDAGKFLRVSSAGTWAAEAIPNAEEASF